MRHEGDGGEAGRRMRAGSELEVRGRSERDARAVAELDDFDERVGYFHETSLRDRCKIGDGS